MPLILVGQRHRDQRRTGDDHGGQAYVHGNLCFAWDSRDTAGRRFAAVSVMRTRAPDAVRGRVRHLPPDRWRCHQGLSTARVSALVPHHKDPRRASKLTAEVIATIADLRGQCLSLRAIGGSTQLAGALVPAGCDLPCTAGAGPPYAAALVVGVAEAERDASNVLDDPVIAAGAGVG